MSISKSKVFNIQPPQNHLTKNTFQTVKLGSKFAFIPSVPKVKGQLYGDLPLGVKLRRMLFEVKGPRVFYSIDHLTLKLLESSPSVHDFGILSTFYQMTNTTFNPGWLNDTAIDAYLEIYCRQFPELQVLSCSEVLGLHCDRDVEVTQKSRRAHLRLNAGAQKLIMPFNEAKHWTLIIYDIVADDFLYLDSLSVSVPDDKKMARIRLRLKYWWDIHSKHGVPARNVPCDQQKDGKSCGIFVLHFVELCSLGQSYLQKCDPEKFRLKVFQTIIKDPGNSVSTS
jgi:Ulp1 protease family, C-terminal catalytic domain